MTSGSSQQEQLLNEMMPSLKSSFPNIDKNNEQQFYERLLKVNLIGIQFNWNWNSIQFILEN